MGKGENQFYRRVLADGHSQMNADQKRQLTAEHAKYADKTKNKPQINTDEHRYQKHFLTGVFADGQAQMDPDKKRGAYCVLRENKENQPQIKSKIRIKIKREAKQMDTDGETWCVVREGKANNSVGKPYLTPSLSLPVLAHGQHRAGEGDNYALPTVFGQLLRTGKHRRTPGRAGDYE